MAAGINDFLGEMREVQDPEQTYIEDESTWPIIPEKYVNELLKTHAILETDNSKFKVYPNTTNMDTEILAAAAVLTHTNPDKSASETMENELEDPLAVVQDMTLISSNELNIDVTGC